MSKQVFNSSFTGTPLAPVYFPVNYFALILLFLICSALNIKALPGGIDTTFGDNGKVRTLVSSGGDYGHASVVQPDGKIIVVGDIKRNFSDFGIVRYNPDGSLDSGFGLGGKVATEVGTSWDKPYAVVIQTDGKIVLVGSAFVSGIYCPALVRLNTDGSLDSSFGTGGKVITPSIGSNGGGIYHAAIQADNKVVVVGETRIKGITRAVLLRYDTNGSLDTSFDGDGILLVQTSTGSRDYLYSISVQPDGKIIAAGSNWDSVTTMMLVVRLNPNGSPDNSFGSGGAAKIDYSPETIEGASDVVLQADGKIVLVGAVNGGTMPEAFALTRINPNGSLDTSFGTNGFTFTNIEGFPSANCAVLQKDGKIVVGGHNQIGSFRVIFVVARYNSNGSPDSAFGNNGIVFTDVSGNVAYIYDIVLQRNGRIIAVGRSGNSDTEGDITSFATVQYLSNGTVTADFDGDSKTDISIYRPPVGEWWYLKSSNGGNAAFQFGNSSDKIVPADFTGDGKTDVAIFRPSSGEWFILRSEDYSYYSYPFGASGDIPAAGDFDADGKADSAVFRPADTNWYIRRSSDGGFTIQQFGIKGDVPVVADYDSDGKSDIAIYRPSVGEWWIQRSRLGIIAFTFGTNSDKPVQGDYTGDGKADVAIFRPSTGEWFILRSEDFSYYSFPFGATGDIPAPGDFDGDGKFDATVFRPSGSTWFVQRSTAGTLIQDFGISGDKPVPNAFVP